MKWSEFSIHTTQEAVEPISNILHESGASGVVIEDILDFLKERKDEYGEIYQLNPSDYPEEGVIVKAYFPFDNGLLATIEDIKNKINLLSQYDIDLGLNRTLLSEVDDEDWATAWKQYYHPVRISERITVVPTWEEYTPSEGELIIELDPGMAFGTGTHPTTTMCVRALEKYVQPGDTIIDVGTGSGVLSIAAAKLGAKRVEAYDLDMVAVTSATENITLNKVNDVVTVGQNNLLNGIEGPVDIVVGNLLAKIVMLFVDEAARVVKPNGLFITSGIIESQQAEIEEELTKHGFVVEEVLKIEDWVAIIARNSRK
ncbi:MAG: 50S ribosomal protein L11 methyltransferase [Bacillaceae bacterium]